MHAPLTESFALVDSRPLPEIDGHGDLYRHISGAEILSIRCPDDNKVFGINFLTPPIDHTGLPHILEHSVLCGSRRFPVKEPFKEMLKTSLQTFLNAFTYPDRTCYPVASRNLRDFHNLIDVYLDAVFFPRLTPAVLGQEGWRLNWPEGGGPEFQGVVFNEMKGVYASPESRAYEAIQQEMFPDTVYRFDSGGDPAHIPALTFGQFLQYHRAHYHPANARVFFYGNDDAAGRLVRIDAALRAAANGPVPIFPPLQAPWGKTRRVEKTYPCNEEGDEGHFALQGWLLGETNDLLENLRRGILNTLLLHTPASPLRLALLDSGLGEDVIGGGVDSHLRQALFTVGLKGVEAGDGEKVFRLIHRSLADIVRDGFRPDLIEGAFNSIEFHLREQNTGSTPRGLVVMLRALAPWLYGASPLDALEFRDRLARLRAELAEAPRLFEEWIQRHLLDNASRVELLLSPDLGLTERERQAEGQKLADLAARFQTEPELESAFRTLAQEVKAFQETPDAPEALASLPTLRLDDVELSVASPPQEETRFGEVPGLMHEVAGRDILYINLMFDLRGLDQSDLCLLPLYGRALTELGTQSMDHIRFSEQVSCHTGGIEPSFFTGQHRGSGELVAKLIVRAKCLRAKIPTLCGLLRDMLREPRFDQLDRLRQLILEEKAAEESNLVPAGSTVVRNRLNASYCLFETATEQMDGLSYLDALRELEALPAHHAVDRLERLHRRLIQRDGCRIHLAADAPCLAEFARYADNLVGDLPSEPLLSFPPWQCFAGPGREGLVVPSPVNFVGLSTHIQAVGCVYQGSTLVANRLLRNDYLWDQIRLRGGAYGASCSHDRESGVMTFTSYRDPQVAATLERFIGAADYLRNFDLDAPALEQALIGTLGAMDPVRLPETEGYTALVRHLTGLTEADRLRFRREIRATTAGDLRQYGEFLRESLSRDLRVCVLGGREALADPALSLTLRNVMA